MAPLIDTAELFAKSSEFASPTEAQHRDSNPTSGRRLYSYVFHKEEDADPVRPSVEQRLGSMHGSELDYLFGAPLAIQLTGRSLGHFATNLSKPTDVSLSETIITYFSNFAKFGYNSLFHFPTLFSPLQFPWLVFSPLQKHSKHSKHLIKTWSKEGEG